MDSQIPFEHAWELLSHELATPRVIRNWTVDGGYLGENFTAQQNGITITCVLPNNNEIQVPQDDFEKVHQMWPRYLVGMLQRPEIRDVTRHSKYIISIFHQFLPSSK